MSDCVAPFLARLGLARGRVTDPAVLGAVLSEDLLLGSFAPLLERLGDALEQPVPLDPLLDAMADAVRTRHPIVGQALEQVLGEVTVPPEHAATLDRLLHHTWLLEEVARGIVDDPAFLEALHAHVMELRAGLGIRSGFFAFVEDVFEATGGGVFEAAKIRTLDLVIDQYRAWRTEPCGELDESDRFRKNAGLKLNIMEAVTKDLAAGHLDNAHVGFKLAMLGVRELRVVGSNKAIQQVFAPGWTELYESWNLAFVLANLDNLDLLLPKLLVPSVLAAEPEDYLFRRGAILWFSANITLFALVRAHAAGTERAQPIPRMPDLAERWGGLNAEHARGLLAEHLGRDA